MNGTEIKKNLFGLMDHGYIVTITTNNSVFLVNKITLEVLDMIEMPCSGFNETDGDLYFR